MSNWYYADAQRQRQGPLAAEELIQRFRQGHLQLDTLVWREGLGEWQPLGAFNDELALNDLPSEAIAATAATTPFRGHAKGVDSPYAPPVASLAARPVVAATGNVVNAGFWKRVAASTLDGLLMGAVVVLILVIGAAMLGIGMSSMAEDFAKGAIGGLFILGIYVVPIILQAVYFTWMHASEYQATLGKLAVGIKVVRSDGTRLSTQRSLGRWAAYFFMHLFTCGLTSLVSAFMVGLSLRKQGLHDLVADTLVVDKWAFTAHPERQRHELGAVTVAVMILLALLVVGYIILLIGMGVMAQRAGA